MFLSDIFCEDLEPDVLDARRVMKNIGLEEEVELEYHDTSGNENFRATRQIQYHAADCFMLCVACND